MRILEENEDFQFNSVLFVYGVLDFELFIGLVLYSIGQFEY